ncbi:homoserine kinase [Nocardioides dilutus]
MTLVEGPVRVEVPATSANLGPGFDSLGLALELRDRLEAEVRPEGLVVEVTGHGADSVPRDASHLVVRSMTAAFEALGVTPAGLRLACDNAIPHARGLGSSSAAIVGGLVLARALVRDGPERLDDHALFRLAAEIEGHPDNVAPAAYGGFVISGREAGEWYAVRAPVDGRVVAAAFVPADPLSTEVARGLLPETVPHADAAADAGRSALLVAALGGATEHLLTATRDYLHQEQRRPAMPDSLALVDRLRSEGHAAVVSGAGPTVLVLADSTLVSAGDLAAACPVGWEHHVLLVADEGARVVSPR